MLWVFGFILTLFVIFTLLTKSVPDQEGDGDIILELKEDIQPWSGLDESLFIKFSNNLDIFHKNIEHVDISSKYLYNALDNLYDLQLTDQEFDFSDKINNVAMIGEEMLLRSSLKHGNLFNPKYLNK
jgi:hypothetical protein